MRLGQLTIIGVGLIGASIGRAAKARALVDTVVGYDTSTTAIADALQSQAIDISSPSLKDAVTDADLVMVCTPVNAIAEHVVQANSYLKPGAVITDTGSTKAAIVAKLKELLPADARFVGGHPMAGSEKKGPKFARTDLFEGRPILLTPAPTEALAQVKAFWQALGGRPVEIGANEHDRTVALVSHLPHAVAAALALVPSPEMIALSAGGFRDTTRVAGAGAGIWEPIFRANKTAVLEALNEFENKLNEFRQLVAEDNGTGLVQYLNTAKRVRDELGS